MYVLYVCITVLGYMYVCAVQYLISFHRLLFFCHCVFYRQLSAWVLYGIIEDTHGEFLVQRVVKREDKAPPPVGEEDVEEQKQEEAQGTDREGRKKVSFKDVKSTKKGQHQQDQEQPQVGECQTCI